MKDIKTVKHELQNIIYGKGDSGQNNIIKTVQTYLRSCKEAGGKTKGAEFNRAEEEGALKKFATDNNLFISKTFLGSYITEGAEQKIFYKENDTVVYKIADAIFYQNWEDYFNNLLVHNYFFPDTAYKIEGFIEEEGKFYIVVSQPFVFNTQATNLNEIKEYLTANGFYHKKNNDYFHPYLGIILEDLHDENVLTSNGLLFFIDTVFYLTKEFYLE